MPLVERAAASGRTASWLPPNGVELKNIDDVKCVLHEISLRA